jgi:D-beta-D-heptose 7-phosphate kinase/D-beta-D-heptose 1-phosphate adenosyltransferase
VSSVSWRPWIERFSHLKVLVVGDLMLDHFIWGSVSRISPEAPVPVVEVIRESEMPGGAGNVAINLAALGAEAFVVGLLGVDAPGDRLLSRLQQAAIHVGHLVRASERPTILKSRIIAHHQQVVRVDREIKGDLSAALQRQIWEQIEQILPKVQAVVLSDYGKGVISPALIRQLLPLLRRRGVPVTVDPKVENFSTYRGVTCITPNLLEAMEGMGVRQVESEEDIEALGQRLLRRLQCASVLITRGENGMSLFVKGKAPLHIPTRAREVFDVTGAGDTVIGTFTLGLAAGAPMRVAAELANYAAGIVVGKLGTASVTKQELLAVLRSRRA